MIRQAQSILRKERLIEPVQGKGTFVIALPGRQGDHQALRQAAEDLKAALDDAQSALIRLLAHLGDDPIAVPGLVGRLGDHCGDAAGSLMPSDRS
jgi:DNA-binding GntR family transcriptional regulator